MISHRRFLAGTLAVCVWFVTGCGDSAVFEMDVAQLNDEERTTDSRIKLGMYNNLIEEEVPGTGIVLNVNDLVEPKLASGKQQSAHVVRELVEAELVRRGFMAQSQSDSVLWVLNEGALRTPGQRAIFYDNGTIELASFSTPGEVSIMELIRRTSDGSVINNVTTIP